MEVARLRRFLDNLLDMVRIDAGALQLHLEPIDLVDAIGGAVHDLKDLFRGRHVDLKVAANLPFVIADATLLHHMLINLLSNAALHGGEVGVITVEANRTRDGLVLSIRDRGPSLPTGSEERIFETFAQGTGSDRLKGFQQWRWHLDEVYVKINDETQYLWRAVDYEGEILESFVTKKRDKAAALVFLKMALKRHGRAEEIVTDGLRSYRAAMGNLAIWNAAKWAAGSITGPRTRIFHFDKESGQCCSFGR